jgi:hypothetical protein
VVKASESIAPKKSTVLPITYKAPGPGASKTGKLTITCTSNPLPVSWIYYLKYNA